jgi:hypothetical protein
LGGQAAKSTLLQGSAGGASVSTSGGLPSGILKTGGMGMPTKGKFLVILCSLLFAGPLLAVGLPSVESDYSINGYEVLLVVHQLLFVFWLGPDIGVYAWSRKVINTELTPDQRVAAGDVMHTIDIMPRVCLSLMLTVGGILTEAVGIEHPLWQLGGIILLGPVWLTIVLVAYIKEGTALGATVNRLDLWLRWALFVGIIISVAYSTITGRLDVAPWVGSKLLLFAALIFFGILFRLRMRPFFSGLEALVKDGPSEGLNTQLATSQRRGQPFQFAIWVCILLAAGLGVFQPGPGNTGDDLARENAPAVSAP